MVFLRKKLNKVAREKIIESKSNVILLITTFDKSHSLIKDGGQNFLP